MASFRQPLHIPLRIQPPSAPPDIVVQGGVSGDIVPGTLAINLSLEETEDPAGVPGDVAGVEEQQFLTGFTEVANYASLPADPDFGDFVLVSGDGFWEYLRWIGGTPAGLWLPTQYAGRITDYIRDASGNPCKISCGIGGDDLAAVNARGWATVVTAPGSVADVGGDIEIDSGAAGATSAASLHFTPATTLPTQRIFIVAELDVAQLGDAATRTMGKAYLYIVEGVSSWRPPLSFTQRGQANKTGLAHRYFEHFGSMGLTYGSSGNYDYIQRTDGGHFFDEPSPVHEFTLYNTFYGGFHVRNANNPANDGAHAIYAANDTTLYTELGTLAAGSGDNSAIVESMPGRGILDTAGFKRFFSDLGFGYAHAGNNPQNYGHHRLWFAEDGVASKDDHIAPYLLLGPAVTASQTINLTAWSYLSASISTKLRVREFHAFTLEG